MSNIAKFFIENKIIIGSTFFAVASIAITYGLIYFSEEKKHYKKLYKLNQISKQFFICCLYKKYEKFPYHTATETQLRDFIKNEHLFLSDFVKDFQDGLLSDYVNEFHNGSFSDLAKDYQYIVNIVNKYK